jgi:EmrB/QacA subfamily drug resistance transporter
MWQITKMLVDARRSDLIRASEREQAVRSARSAPGGGAKRMALADPDTAYRRRWATLGVLCVSLLVIGLDNTILNVALPTLSRDLQASESQLQWIVDAYTLVFAGLLLTAGSLGDRLGRRRALVAGLAVFAGGSLWAAWSSSPGELMAARGVMGAGGAFIMPSTLSVLTNSFRDPAERTKAIGIWAAVSGVGIVLGPACGGWLLEHYWWGSVFLVNVPIALGAIVAARWLVPESRDPAAPRTDYLGAALSIAGLATLVWAIIEAPTKGWTSQPVLTAFALAAVLLTGFTVWERRAPEPMLNLTFLRSARFSAAAVSVTLAFFALFGSVFFLSQYLQFVLGYTPLETGVRVMPVATLVIGAPLAVGLSRRLGDKLVVAAGLALVSAALLLLATTSASDGYGHVAVVLITLGLGLGLAMTPATDAVMGSLPAAKAGVGSAMNDTTRQIGGALGVAVLGSVLSSGYTAHLGTAGRPVPHEARDGIGAAMRIADQLPGAAGAALSDAARTAFLHGMGLASLMAAAVAAGGALVALLWLPARAPAPVEPLVLPAPDATSAEATSERELSPADA